jgi:hypothetical protein
MFPAKARSSWGGVRGGTSYKKGLPDSSSLERTLVLARVKDRKGADGGSEIKGEGIQV